MQIYPVDLPSTPGKGITATLLAASKVYNKTHPLADSSSTVVFKLKAPRNVTGAKSASIPLPAAPSSCFKTRAGDPEEKTCVIRTEVSH